MAKVIQNEEAPVEKEVLAEAIVKVSDGYTSMAKSGLNRRAIIVLLQDFTGLPKGRIQQVLDALPELKKAYCK